jgi:hypothetical protein
MFVCVLRGSAVERTPKNQPQSRRARGDGPENKNNLLRVDIILI